MKKKFAHWLTGVFVLGLSAVLISCNSGGGGSSGGGSSRSYLMGTTPFFMTPTTFADWRFENLDDKDLLSLHVDDFWGVPWTEFATGPNPTLPAAWVNQWTNFTNAARATGKTLFLSVSPLSNRTKLAKRVETDGSGNLVYNETWSPVDGNGCYPFATDANAATYKTAYINFVKYVINLVQPTYFSPAVEMNVQFVKCSTADKNAYIAWYADVHNAIKATFPNLIVFPTMQVETLYGIVDASVACPGIPVDDCFTQRLNEALTVPADRVALSTYPIFWKFRSEYGFTYPTNTYARIRAATAKKLWISETGWQALRVRASYQHGGSGACGPDLLTSSMANDTEQANYMSWLLGETQSQGFEAVIWWLNRDYLDGAVADTCPCSPAASDTCMLADQFYAFGGDTFEFILREFGNMALRNYDGSPRSGHATWRSYFNRSHQP